MAQPSKRPPRGLREGQRRYQPLPTAKLFRNGRSQAVRLPKDCRFDGDEVYVKRQGRVLTLIPKDDPWRELFEAVALYDESVPIERLQPKSQQVRKSLDAPLPRSRRRDKNETGKKK